MEATRHIMTSIVAYVTQGPGMMVLFLASLLRHFDSVALLIFAAVSAKV